MDRCHRIGQTKKVFIYRLITSQTVEENMIERQAIKLKLDQIVIQKGGQVKNQSLSSEEYTDMLSHGAQQIFLMKNDKVDSNKIVNLDQLIKEGEAKHHKNMQAAAKNVESQT